MGGDVIDGNLVNIKGQLPRRQPHTTDCIKEGAGSLGAVYYVLEVGPKEKEDPITSSPPQKGGKKGYGGVDHKKYQKGYLVAYGIGD